MIPILSGDISYYLYMSPLQGTNKLIRNESP